MKINVCSGRHVLKGWTNVDAVVSNHPKVSGPPDIIADMRKIPLPDNCADELMCIHGVEHVQPYEADEALQEWRRLLKPGGLLILECPDLIKCCENVLSGYTVPGKHPDQFGIFGLYGDYRPRDPFMTHRFAYSPKSMRAKLELNGYVDIQDGIPEWHAAGRYKRDMRITARKPA